jgi:hypothetical protein
MNAVISQHNAALNAPAAFFFVVPFLSGAIDREFFSTVVQIISPLFFFGFKYHTIQFEENKT